MKVSFCIKQLVKYEFFYMCNKLRVSPISVAHVVGPRNCSFQSSFLCSRLKRFGCHIVPCLIWIRQGTITWPFLDEIAFPLLPVTPAQLLKLWYWLKCVLQNFGWLCLSLREMWFIDFHGCLNNSLVTCVVLIVNNDRVKRLVSLKNMAFKGRKFKYWVRILLGYVHECDVEQVLYGQSVCTLLTRKGSVVGNV